MRCDGRGTLYNRRPGSSSPPFLCVLTKPLGSLRDRHTCYVPEKEGFSVKGQVRGGAQGQDSSLDGGVSILHDGSTQLPHRFTALGTAATMRTSAMPASLQHRLPDPGQEPGTWQVTLSAAKSTKSPAHHAGTTTCCSFRSEALRNIRGCGRW